MLSGPIIFRSCLILGREMIIHFERGWTVVVALTALYNTVDF